MSLRIGICAGCCLMAALAVPLGAQTTQESRVDRLEKRLNDLEQKYHADIQTRDQEIARLKAQVGAAPTSPSQDRRDAFPAQW